MTENNVTDQKQPMPGMKINETLEKGRRSTIEIDYEYYQQFLDNPNATEQQKRDLIEAFWSICMSFVELGYGIHPVQQACEQRDKLGQISTSDLMDVLELKSSPRHEFGAKSGNESLPQGEGDSE